MSAGAQHLPARLHGPRRVAPQGAAVPGARENRKPRQPAAAPRQPLAAPPPAAEWLKTRLTQAGFEYRFLSGSMALKKRAKFIKEFQEAPPTTGEGVPCPPSF